MSPIDKILPPQKPADGRTGPVADTVLRNHPTQRPIAIDGWRSALFGLPFLTAGILMGLAALGLFHGRRNAPDWLIGIFGAMFFLSGLFLLVHGLLGWAKRSSYLKAAAERPGQPWFYDFHWRQDGIEFSAFHAMVERLVAAVVWSAFLVPFFWIGLNTPGAWLFLVIASLFGLVSVFLWYRWLQMLADLFLYGNSFLSYDTFPYFLGGRMRARLRIPKHLSAIEALSLTLRCVQEEYVTTGTGSSRSTTVVCYERYKDSLTYTREQITGLAGGEIAVEFNLPDNHLTTNLATDPPLYWEIEARGKSRQAGYEAYFLIPVYQPR